MTDKKGYSIVQDAQGWYVYAKKIFGELVSSGLRVGYGNPKKLGLTTDLKVDPSKRLNNLHPASKEHRNLLYIPTSALCNFQGTASNPCRRKALVVLIKFSDHGSRKLSAAESIDIMFNRNGPTDDNTAPTGSVADVWRANSYDSFVIESHVTDWISVLRTEAQTVGGQNGLNTDETKKTWRMAMEMVERNGPDLSQFDEDNDGFFDCLVLLHSGAAAEAGGDDCESGNGWENRIWSHAVLDAPWFQSTTGIRTARHYVTSAVWDTCPPNGKGTKWDIARIAVIAHECAHFLGLPDLYNLDSNGGAGSYDLLGKNDKTLVF
jgi:M6 family metalloprotease-like protein